jgi:hypothetical protein
LATVLAIPDLHCPFEHRDALDFLKAVRKQYRTDAVVCLGDEADMHAMSMHDHDPDGHSAGDEHEKMLGHLRPFYEAFPQVASMHSNHTARPYRRAAKFGIPSVYLRTYADFMAAPKGWSWHEEIEVDGVGYEHGEGYSGWVGALTCAQRNMQPRVIGHLHGCAGVVFDANPRYLFWGMNAGCLIDRRKYAFAYGKTSKHKPILGCGVIRDRTPTFVPMWLDKASRWTGEL